LIEINIFSSARHFEDQWDIKIKQKQHQMMRERERKTLEMGMEYMQKPKQIIEAMKR